MQALQFRALRVITVGHASAAALVGFADQHQLCDAFRFAEGIAARQQFQHGAVAQFEQAVHVQVFAAGHHRQFTMFGWHLQTFAQGAQRSQSRVFMADVSGQHVLWRQRFAQVVGQGSEADHRITRRQSRGHVADQFLVQAGVHFRVVFRTLRHAVQRIHFRQHLRQCIAVAQCAQERGRRGAGECA